jgi:hypothetical protein
VKIGGCAHQQAARRPCRPRRTVRCTAPSGAARRRNPPCIGYTLCDDPAYVFAPTALALLAGDLFALKHRLVELVVDGKPRGLYLMFEKTKEELVRDSARVTSVMRRDVPVAGADDFDVVYASDDDDDAALERYAAFARSLVPLSGDALVSALRSRLDLDQYVRFLATESILKSGDYVDEVFFIGSEQADGKGATTEAYRVMVWDPEGYTDCHEGGVNAFPDPDGLAYCAEAVLDRKLLTDPKVYALFVGAIEEALAGRLSREKVAAALASTKLAFHAQLTAPAVCAAMTELLALDPGAADCAVARKVIATRADAILASYDARRAFLLGRLAAYHAKP